MSRDDWPGNERFGPVTIFRPKQFSQLATDMESKQGRSPTVGPPFHLVGLGLARFFR